MAAEARLKGDESADGKSVVGALTQLFGLFAGVATVFYALGGLIVGLRLWYAGFPVWAVVNQLPRELLVTEALVYVGLPLAVLVLGYAALFSLLGRTPAGRTDFGHQYDRFGTREDVAYAVVTALLLLGTVIGASALVFGHGETDHGWTGKGAVVGAVIVATTALFGLATAARRRIRFEDEFASLRRRQEQTRDAVGRMAGAKPRDTAGEPDVATMDLTDAIAKVDEALKALEAERSERPPLGRLLVLGTWSVLPLLPLFVALGSSVGFPRVKGCAVSGVYARAGSLISHSTSTLYVGVDDEDLGEPLIVAIPMGRVEEAIIGSAGTTFERDGGTPPRCDPPSVKEDR